MCDSRAELEASLSRLVAGLDPSSMHGNDAKVLVGYFSRLEHLASAAKALCALRVAATGAFEADGHRHAGEWLATKTGDSVGSAISTLEAASKLSGLPELEEAFRSGELSLPQVKQVAGAASLDPGSTRELIDAARTEDLEGLRRRCEKLKAARVKEEDQKARAARLHSSRRLRTWTDEDGAFRLDARLTPEAGASVLSSLKAESDRIFAGARASGVRESSGAYLADALVSLLSSPGPVGESRRPKALVHLRVDIEALRRGNTGPGETCEIAGVGPVSIATARELLGDCIANLLVTSSSDVHAICNLGRAVPTRLYHALLERDRCCAVPGCSATYNLEIDHRVVPFADGGPTRLENLARICHHHHFLKTYEGYRLEGEPGAWVWVHPDGTRQGPGAKAPPRDEAPSGDEAPPGGRALPRDDVPPPTQSTLPEQSSLFAGAG